MNMPFWQQFAFKICNELGVNVENITQIDLTIVPGKPPKIVIIKELFTEEEFRRLPQIFEAADWKEKA